MAKYSYEFKKQIVMDYLEGHGGYNSLTAKYKLGTNSQLRRWVAAYNSEMMVLSVHDNRINTLSKRRFL